MSDLIGNPDVVGGGGGGGGSCQGSFIIHTKCNNSKIEIKQYINILKFLFEVWSAKFQFLQLKKSLYIAWTSFRDVLT